MAKKSNFIKNLLTTASAVAVLAGGAQEVMAAERVTNILAVTIHAGVGTVAAAFNDGDALKIHADNVAITVGAVHTVSAIDLNNKTGTTLGVDENLNLGSVGANGVGAAAIVGKTLAITVTDAKVLTLTGKNNNSTAPVPVDTYTGLGAVTLGSAAAGAAKVVINGAAGALTFGNTFDGDADDKGLMEVSTAATFNAAIGATHSLADIKVTAAVAATFNKSVNSTTVTLANAGSILNLGNAAADADVTITGKVVASGANLGIINFKGQDSSIIGNVGTFGGHGVATINIENDINAAITGDVTTNGANGINFSNAASKLTLTAGTVANKAGDGNTAGYSTLTGDLVSLAGAGNGVLAITDSAIVNGKIGNANAIDKVILGTGTLELQGAVTKTANGIEFGDAGSVLKLSTADQTITSNIKNTTGADGNGKILISDAHSHTIIGNIGENAAIDEIRFDDAANASILTIGDNAGAANFLTTTNGVVWGGGAANGGILKSKSADLTINSDVGTAAKKLTEVTIDLNFAGGALGKVTLAAGKKIYANDIKIVAGQANRLELLAGAEVYGTVGLNDTNVLKFAGDGSKVVGEIKGTINQKGIVEVAEDAFVTGKIGSGVNTIDSLVFSVADKTLTVDAGGAAGSIKANAGIKFDTNAILTLTGNQDHAIDSVIEVGANNAGAAGGVGTVVISNAVDNTKTVTFSKQIGDSGNQIKALKELRNDGNAKIEFNGNAANINIEKLVLNGDTTVKLNKATDYRFGGITVETNNTNTLEIAEDVALVGNNNGAPAVNFGDEDGVLKALHFSADKTLTIGDGINIYANEVTNAVANEGIIEFKGSSIFSAPIANGKALNQIKLGADNKVVKIQSNIKTNGAIQFTGNGTFEFGGTSLEVAHVNGIDVNGKAGKLKFTNTGATTINSALSSVGALAGVEFAGGNVTFTAGKGFTHAADITLSSVAASTIEFNVDTDIGNNKIISTSANTQTVVVNKDTTFTKAVGDAATNKFVNIQLKGDVVATADSAANPTTSLAAVTFTTNGDNTGTLIIDEETTKIRGVGSDLLKYKTLTFAKSAEVTGDVFANEITVEVGDTATFGGRVKGTSLTLNGADSAAVFASGASLESNLVANAAGEGIATFAGSATLNNAIGASNAKLAKVEFTGAAAGAVRSDIVLKKDIHATAINFAAQNITVGAPVKLDGNTTLTSSNVILGGNKLNAAGNLTATGEIHVTTSIDQDASGNITGGSIKSEGALDTSGVTKLTIKVNGSVAPKSTAHTFTILESTGTLTGNAFDITDASKFILDADATALSKWTPAAGDKGSIVLISENNVVGGITERFKTAGVVMSSADSRNIVMLQNATGDGEKLVNALSRMDSKKTVEALQRLIANEVNQELENVVTDAATSVASRMFVSGPGNLGGQPIESAYNDASPYSGVAAGEEAGRYGVWANPFFGNGTQKARKGTAGYKSERYGASVGFDVKANDNMMVGAALTYLNTNIKHKNQKAGDTTKADSLLFSIYGMQQFTDNWFGQGIATFGSNKVKNNEGRVVSQTETKRAIGNYTSMSFGGELMAGYNYFTDQFTVTPMAGLRYTRVNDGGYRESGADFENLDVSKKASNKFEVVIGARAAARAFELNGMYVTPEVHGFINHDIVGKNPEVQMRLNGVNSSLASNKAKPARTNYTLGAGLNASYGMMDYGVGYDANIANKYLGHQGSIKVRVNF